MYHCVCVNGCITVDMCVSVSVDMCVSVSVSVSMRLCEHGVT